jgi:putative hydrolase of the HAD superfamily
MKDHFSHVTTWVFDLDNTLYPPRMRLFDQIEARMVAYVMSKLNVDRAEADRLRRVYWQEYGTTLAGLMAEHDLDPVPFMVDVHDVDFSILTPDPVLRQRIAQLRGRKIIYTNGSAPYAGNVLAARGLDGLFDDIYGVEHASYRPKPEAAAFEQVFARAKLEPTRAAMFEDEARNLAVPHALGLRTVHVAPNAKPADHIHHHTDDLSGFLAQVVD